MVWLLLLILDSDVLLLLRFSTTVQECVLYFDSSRYLKMRHENMYYHIHT